MRSPQAAVPSGNTRLHWRVPIHRLQGNTCSTTVSSTGCSVCICSTMVLSTGCRGVSALAPAAPPLPPPSLTSVPAGLLLILFPSLVTAFVAFCLFLHTLSLRCHHLGCGAQLCPMGHLLELEETVCVWHRAAPGLSSQRLPCRPQLPTPPMPSTIQGVWLAVQVLHHLRGWFWNRAAAEQRCTQISCRSL